MVTGLTHDYEVLLESLEIPVKALPTSSYRTPEWEVLNEIRQNFSVPATIATRAPLANYLSENVSLDDFFSFLGFLIQPFARMVVEIYGFLQQYERSASSGQTITQIRIGPRTAFPVDLKFMPRELLKVLTETFDASWDVNALMPLQNLLPMIEAVARCDGKYRSAICRTDCFQHCREGISSVVRDVESILGFERLEMNGTPSGEGVAVGEGVAGTTRLAAALRETLQSFLRANEDAGQSQYTAASDCLPGQRPGVAPDELYTQRYIANVRNVLNGAQTKVKTHREEIKEFLNLPYWRRRNDLYEVWILTKICSQFRQPAIQLCNIDSKGHWNIPGNGQGELTKPIIKISAPVGRYQLFTGLKLKNFTLPDECAGFGAMPDWLFCREVDDFDFDLFNDERDRLRLNRLVPEFIVECKAGASYSLLKTIEETMKRRYLPLLRTDRGRAVLVNYRRFTVPQSLDKSPTYRSSIRHMYTRILALEGFSPQSPDPEKEFVGAVKDVFGINALEGNAQTVDLVLVLDTTGSMEAYLKDLRDGWADCVREILLERDAIIGAIAIGDHGEEDQYDVRVLPLTDKTDEAIQFLYDVPNAHGGDTPEAYEDALHALVALNWRPHAEKMVVFVGDAYPHPPDQCPFNYDWTLELARLETFGVVINSVRFQGGAESENFFKRISSQTNGTYVEVNTGLNAVKAIRECVAKESS